MNRKSRGFFFFFFATGRALRESTFCVVQPIDRQDNASIIAFGAYLRYARHDLGRRRQLAPRCIVDADRVLCDLHCATLERHCVAARVFDVAEQLSAALHVARVAERVEPDDVGAKKALKKLCAPRNDAEHFRRREGHVVEVADLGVRLQATQHVRHEHELVVVHPDDRLVVDIRRNNVRESNF
jgi:hypothetical protein